MAKYPGQQILFEVGTNVDLAKIYGVSERTIYRWKTKASQESGIIRPTSKRPSDTAIASFKGTRKALAKKYGVSERTVYRWLDKARSSRLNVPSRINKSKYIGAGILDIKGTNKELAKKFGVSERTITRWKTKARTETGLLPDLRKTGQYKLKRKGGYSRYEYIGDEAAFEQEFENAYDPNAVIEPPESEPLEPYEEPIEGPANYGDIPENDTLPDEFEDYADFGISDDMFGNLKGIEQSIFDNDLVNSDSIFWSLTYKERILYINNYLQYQYDLDPSQFYDPVTHKFRFDTEWVTNYIDIWGDEFENWAQNQFESDMYEI